MSNGRINIKWKRKKKYLQTATHYYTEEIKNLNDVKNEDKRNFFIQITGVNEGMIVTIKLLLNTVILRTNLKVIT